MNNKLYIYLNEQFMETNITSDDVIEKDKEIEKLKKKLQQKENIINQLEKWAKSIQLTVYRSDDMPVYQHQDVLDKLKELKEGYKE